MAIQFVDFHTGQVMYDALYNIRKETPMQSQTTTDTEIVPGSATPPPDGMGGNTPAPFGGASPVAPAEQNPPSIQ